MSAIKGKSTVAFRTITLLIFGMGILLCSLSFALVDFQFRQDLESRTREVNAHNLDMALSLAQNMNRSFAQADTILKLLKTEMEADGSLDKPHTVLLNDFLKFGIFNQIAIADSRGDLVYSAVSLNAPQNVSDREHFLAHIKVDSGEVYIAAPRILQVAGGPSIFLSRRLNDTAGNFAGIVSVGITPDYFAKSIEQLQIETHHSFLLLTIDGVFLARFPNIDSVEYRIRVKTHPVLAQLKEGASFGLVGTPGGSDGTLRIGAFHKLSDYPAFVLAGMEREEAFRAVTGRGSDYRNWAGMFSAILSVILFLLWRQVRKQYRIEKTLISNEGRLNRAQSMAHAGNWEIELDSGKVWASAEAFRIYGIEYVSPYLSLQTIQQAVCTHEDRVRLDKALRALVEKNKKYDVEFKINRVDNGLEKTLHSIAELEYDQNGTPIKIIGVVQDVTERKQAEEALAESEARYRAVIEQAPEAVLLCDPDTGDVVETNSRFTERLGYDLRQDGTLNLFKLIAEDPEKIRASLDSIAKTGSLPLQRRLFNHRNGSLISVERTATLVSYRGRRLFVMTLRDVSEEVRREQEIHRDAQLATRVQNAMLSVPEPSDHLEITTIFKPFGYVGGDLYFLDWRYGGSLLRGFLVDATGHGLGTALHTASLHVLLREVNERDLTLSDAMIWLNRRAGDYFDDGTFTGALGFELDLEVRQLKWVCAGIPRAWVATKTQLGAVECPGMCLGIRADETFDTHTMPVDAGDSLYFMTDGLSDLLGQRTDLPLDRYREMVGVLRTLSESAERRDDATAVCIHVRSLPQSVVRRDGWPRILRLNGYGDYNRFKGEVAKILAEVTGKQHSMHEVAVNEALSNAMECRDGIPRLHATRLRFNKIGNRFVVRVKTSRLGFAGNAILRRLRSHPEEMFCFGEDAAMGRGIPLMLSMSHWMTYNNDGTEVLLLWKLDGNEGKVE